MKKIIIILSLLLLCGCESKITEYKEISDIVVSLFKTETFDKKNLNNKQISLLDDYIKNLKNPEINVSKYIVYDDIYKTVEKNTKGIYIKNNKCYIRYNDINFVESTDHNTEPMNTVVCNGYYVVLMHDSVKPIELDYNNPIYDYNYLGYYKDDSYHFAYRSYSDGSGLIVTVSDEITIEFTDVNDLKLKTIRKTSYKKYIFQLITIIVLSAIIFLLKKKEKNII